jgi:hypothetical protein
MNLKFNLHGLLLQCRNKLFLVLFIILNKLELKGSDLLKFVFSFVFFNVSDSLILGMFEVDFQLSDAF